MHLIESMNSYKLGTIWSFQFDQFVFFVQDECNCWAFFTTPDITWKPTYVKLDL